MRLRILYPEVAGRDCEHCSDYFYDEKTGRPQTTVDIDEKGEEIEVLLPRPKGIKPPCQTEKGCPKGKPDDPLDFCELTRKAHQHFIECRAVGDFPRDAFVRFCAGVIDTAERDCRSILDQRRWAETLAISAGVRHG